MPALDTPALLSVSGESGTGPIGMRVVVPRSTFDESEKELAVVVEVKAAVAVCCVCSTVLVGD